MKATTYEPCRADENTARCDNLLGVTSVTPKPKREKQPLNVITRMINRCDRQFDGVTKLKLLGVTRHRSGFVTATAVISGNYAERLRMSKKQIKAIWLTLERVAELKGCSERTVWRYIQTNQVHNYKQLSKVGKRNVYKTFVLTDPEVLALELADCEQRNLIPDEIIQTGIEIEGKLAISALIRTYKAVGDLGGQDGVL
jgi:hypothetical protein